MKAILKTLFARPSLKSAVVSMNSMKMAIITVAIAVMVAGCGNLQQIAQTGLDVTQAVGYSPKQLSDGVKEALTISSQRASEQLGAEGGYSTNSLFKISLPSELNPIVEPMRALGLGSYIDNIETLMNQGAEQAAKAAAPVFINAINSMTVNDALGIIRGGDTAATDYFKAQTEQDLRSRYQTIMQNQLQQLGFYNQYQLLAKTVNRLPISNKPDLDLENYAINKGINSLFTQIAKEEANIRANPAQAGSALLNKLLATK